jgi:hypothetical protein
MSNRPHELGAVRAVGRLLEEGGDKAVALDLMDLFFLHGALARKPLGSDRGFGHPKKKKKKEKEKKKKKRRKMGKVVIT